MSNKLNSSKRDIEDIWQQVPPDYYQKSVESNLFQGIWHKKRLNSLLEIIAKHYGQDVKGKKMLDVGCVSGWFISEVAKKYSNFKYYGIDVYKEGIEYGKKLYPTINLQVGDAHKLTFRPNYLIL